jgi:hypothetical protein
MAHNHQTIQDEQRSARDVDPEANHQTYAPHCDLPPVMAMPTEQSPQDFSFAPVIPSVNRDS